LGRGSCTASCYYMMSAITTTPAQSSPTVTDTCQVKARDYVHVGAYTVGSAVVLGTAGGAAGMISGATAGAAAGVLGAVFTFGISIPVCTVIGGGIGLGTGASVGSAAGALGGVAFGLRKLRCKATTHVEKRRCDVNPHACANEAQSLTAHEILDRANTTSMLNCISEVDEEKADREEEHEADVAESFEKGRDEEHDHHVEDHAEDEEHEGVDGEGKECDEPSCPSCVSTNGSASKLTPRSDDTNAVREPWMLTPRSDDTHAVRERDCRLSVLCSVTGVGDVLAVVGSDATFGEWDVSKALKLMTSAAEYPRWSAGFAMPEANSEFKLFILHPDGSITWEPIEENRVWPADARSKSTISTCYGRLGDFVARKSFWSDER